MVRSMKYPAEVVALIRLEFRIPRKSGFWNNLEVLGVRANILSVFLAALETLCYFPFETTCCRLQSDWRIILFCDPVGWLW